MFVMFVFPLVMNCAQYWVIDSFIMERKGKAGSKEGYEAVDGGEGEGYGDEEDGERGVRDEEEGRSGSAEEVDVDVVGKAQVRQAPLKEVNPTPVPDR